MTKPETLGPFWSFRPTGPEPLGVRMAWALSDEARRAIEEIEHNIRMAPHRLRGVILD